MGHILHSLPFVTEKEFTEHIGEDDFLKKYGNPVLIHTDKGEELVCISFELYNRMRELGGRKPVTLDELQEEASGNSDGEGGK